MERDEIKSLVYRQSSNRLLEEEQEYLLFVSDTGENVETEIDVFLTEGTLTAGMDTDIGLNRFLENFEAMYPVTRSTETYALTGEEWEELTPQQASAREEDVEVFDFHFYDDFDYFNISWEQYPETPDDLPENELSVSLDHDNADERPLPELLEPLTVILPQAAENPDGAYQIIGDIMKYLDSSKRFKQEYSALRGFDDQVIQHYLK